MDIKVGDIAFLTRDYDLYFKKKHKDSKLIFSNRLAKLEKIIDWDSDDGKRIMAARVSSNKWEGLSIEDCKFVFSIYFHDLIGRGGEKGVIEVACLFSKDPTTGNPFFVKSPEWIFREIAQKCQEFEVVWKNGVFDPASGQPT